jgi:hypothetical protein
MGPDPNKNWANKKEDIPYSSEFRSPLMPIIQVENKSIPPDGIITFANDCTLSIYSPDKETTIYYTLDGTEPTRKSRVYTGKFKVNSTLTIKAAVFKNGSPKSYTTFLKFRKLDLIAATAINKPKKGIQYSYHKLWQCIKVDDIDRYPIVAEGQTKAVNSDLGFDLPENNGVSYSGYLKIPRSGIYTFYLKSDDGSRLSVDNITIVNNDGSHRPRERSGRIALQKGFHPFEAKHFQGGGKPFIELKWEGPGIKKEIIPESVYFN